MAGPVPVTMPMLGLTMEEGTVAEAVNTSLPNTGGVSPARTRTRRLAGDANDDWSTEELIDVAGSATRTIVWRLRAMGAASATSCTPFRPGTS